MNILTTITDCAMKSVKTVSDDRLLDIIFAFKALLGTLAFFLIVIVWDSLPSATPIASLETKVHLSNRYDLHVLEITETYIVIKATDLVITRFLENESTGTQIRLPSSKHTNEIGRVVEKLNAPLNGVDTGKWCVLSTITWENGLSIYRHSRNFPKTCYEVK